MPSFPRSNRDTYKVGFAQTESNNRWRIAQTKSMQDEAQKRSWQLVHTDAAGSAAKQVADVNSMIAQGVDAIFLAPREEKPLIPAVMAAKKAGIPVILLDRNVDQSLAKAGEDYVTFIGSDFIEEGRAAGRAPSAERHGAWFSPAAAEPDGMAKMIAAQKFFLRAFETEPLKSRFKKVAIPDPKTASDETIQAHCKRFVKTNYHPSGTCRMGPTGDPMAVLDSRLRVRGIEGLRKCDLSAMPNIDDGNTSAPAMMMGSRCAELMLAG